MANNMEDSARDEPETILYIAQHENVRTQPYSSEMLQEARGAGYDLLTTPLTTSVFQSRVLEQLHNHVNSINEANDPANVTSPLISPLMPGDTDLAPGSDSLSLIGFSSPWIDLASPDPLIAGISRQVFKLEVAYAAFCGISNVIVRGPIKGGDTVQFARAIAEGIGLSPYLQLHVLLPMSLELEMDIENDNHLSELARENYISSSLSDDEADVAVDLYDVWDVWNIIRVACDYSPKCTIALEMTRTPPPHSLVSRWFSEPIRLLMLPRTSFIRNEKGYPVFSKQNQQVLARFCRLKYPPWLVLCDLPLRDLETSRDPTPAESASIKQKSQTDPTLNLQYLRYLQRSQPLRSPIERFGYGYQDYVQSPLQPLTDNLESVTYEVFERDPVKYAWYERAIAAALQDLRAKIKDDRRIVVAIVGAGRGPLVTRALQASQKTDVGIECWAVEKNPNALVMLHRRNNSDPIWDGKVSVVKSDMRHWQGPKTASGGLGKADILVSELLGSFADNELSPECLDGVQGALHPVHGISIPQSYSAHVTPLSSARLHADLLSRQGGEKWELPYVVLLHQFDYLSVESETSTMQVPDVKRAWSFDHPVHSAVLQQAHLRSSGTSDAGGWTGGNGSNEHNARSCKLWFTCLKRGQCHGLAGYFETILYAGGGEKIELSTNPVTMEAKSKDMISWFPIFFPLKNPMYIPDDSQLCVSMWRQTDDSKVWYEWLVETFTTTDGRKVRLGMSELHSSRRNGCQM